MSARTEVIDAIEAAQEDRKAAHQAGDQRAVDLIFQEIVQPLNQQLARLRIDPSSEAEELRLTLSILDGGLHDLAAQIAASRVTRTRAQAEELRQLVGTGPAPIGSVNPDIPSTPPVSSLDTPEPPPPGPPTRFVSARSPAFKKVIYIDSEGREVAKEGGTRSWRNNNPGNIRKGDFAENAGAIGDDGSFAIFPDEPTGLAAVVALLRSAKYRELSLRDAIFRYAPPIENDSAAYVSFVTDKTGIAAGEVLGQLPVSKVRAIARAIKIKEGWIAGSVVPAELDVAAEGSNGPVTDGTATEAPTNSAVSAASGAAQEWMSVAQREAALPARDRSEWPDPEENPRILNYFRVAAPWFEPGAGDEVDWCAAFVNFCLETSGHSGTNHPGARSFFWNKMNHFVRLDHPVKGAVAVRRYEPFADPKWESGPGHVGFVTTFSSTHVTLLGGNQKNTVRTQRFPLESRDAAGELTAKFVAFMIPRMS